MKTIKDSRHVEFMQAALDEAQQAFIEEEIPIGAVIVKDNTILVRSHNINRQTNDPTAHAEIIAVQKASCLIKNERLTDCDLYITKEPCAMCAGAIVHARIKTIYIGTKDVRFGACGTALNVCGNNTLNHVPDIHFGILEDESKELLQRFFQQKRTK